MHVQVAPEDLSLSSLNCGFCMKMSGCQKGDGLTVWLSLGFR